MTVHSPLRDEWFDFKQGWISMTADLRDAELMESFRLVLAGSLPRL